MRGIAALLSCLLLGLFADCAAHHSFSKALGEKRIREKEARAAALEWLALVDAADYAAAYAFEPNRLRKRTTQEQFVRSMEGRRGPFGAVNSRLFIGAAFTRKLTGAPDGSYESILFRTSFANKNPAAERVILSQESGQWLVVDYRLY